jgi:hypothetical protein
MPPTAPASAAAATQSPVATSQTGVRLRPNPMPAQLAFVVQPGTHVCVAVQMGRAAPQSEFAKQATQALVAVSHTVPPAVPLQSALSAHSTHC